MAYYIEYYKKEKYGTLNRAREKAIMFMEKEYNRDSNALFVTHGLNIQRGNITIGSVQVLAVGKRRKYFWRTDGGQYRLNRYGEKVTEENWTPFGL